MACGTAGFVLVCLFSGHFQYFWTLDLVVRYKNSKSFLVSEYFLTLNSSTDTNTGVHQNVFHLRCLITHLCLTLSLPSNFKKTNLSNKTFNFHDFQGPTIKFHNFPGLENEILKFHDFPGFPWPVWTLFSPVITLYMLMQASWCVFVWFRKRWTPTDTL